MQRRKNFENRLRSDQLYAVELGGGFFYIGPESIEKD